VDRAPPPTDDDDDDEQNPHPAYRTTEVHQTLPSLAVRQRQRRTIERRSPSPRPEEDDC
jgi:hypothetical protein